MQGETAGISPTEGASARTPLSGREAAPGTKRFGEAALTGITHTCGYFGQRQVGGLEQLASVMHAHIARVLLRRHALGLLEQPRQLARAHAGDAAQLA